MLVDAGADVAVDAGQYIAESRQMAIAEQRNALVTDAALSADPQARRRKATPVVAGTADATRLGLFDLDGEADVSEGIVEHCHGRAPDRRRQALAHLDSD